MYYSLISHTLEKWIQSKLSIKLSPKQIDQFVLYLSELQKWNKKINLVSETSPKKIIERHFIDSLTCLKVSYLMEKIKLIDLGSGGGFPGIPLKIVQPNLQVTLVEPIKKKALFLSHISAVLKLENLSIVKDRAEKIGQDSKYREMFDVAVTRALSKFVVALELALPLVKVDGFYIAMLGSDCEIQVRSARSVLEVLGGTLEQVIKIEDFPLAVERYLVIIKKIKSTPSQFPRAVGVPFKKPLSLNY